MTLPMQSSQPQAFSMAENVDAGYDTSSSLSSLSSDAGGRSKDRVTIAEKKKRKREDIDDCNGNIAPSKAVKAAKQGDAACDVGVVFTKEKSKSENKSAVKTTGPKPKSAVGSTNSKVKARVKAKSEAKASGDVDADVLSLDVDATAKVNASRKVEAKPPVKKTPVAQQGGQQKDDLIEQTIAESIDRAVAESVDDAIAGSKSDKQQQRKHEKKKEKPKTADPPAKPVIAVTAPAVAAASSTGKKSWLDKLPQPGPPPADSPPSGRDQLVHDDIVAAFHAFLGNFQQWQPTHKGPGGVAHKFSRDGNSIEEYYGENKYNYLELCVGIKSEHRHGWGEHVRKPFPTVWKNVLKWVQSDGCAVGGLKLQSSAEFSWKTIVESMWGITALKPSWNELRASRGLAKDGNEMLRKRMTTVVKMLCAELDRIDKKKEKKG